MKGDNGMVNKGAEITIEKVDELDLQGINDDDSEEIEKAESDFELKKWGANVWSKTNELNKDFTLSNLSDQMFNSRVINFILNRIELIKLLRNVFRYADRKVDEDTNIIVPEIVQRRIVFETLCFRRNNDLIMSKVYTILNLSKGRGGLVLKAFLEGGATQEEMEMIAGQEGPAIGEPIKRSGWDRLLGRNKVKKGRPKI